MAQLDGEGIQSYDMTALWVKRYFFMSAAAHVPPHLSRGLSPRITSRCFSFLTAIKWLDAVRGHESDKEHGERCSLCFRFNLERTAEKAAELGIDEFATTLTVSRFKNSAKIFHEGEDLPGFLKIDFKKKDGFNRSIVLSKELGLYRQDYCGCEFSLRDRRCGDS